MSEEEKDLVSEGPEEQQEEQVVEQEQEVEAEQQERTVPLSALEAERRKRQDVEAENRLYQQHLLQSQQKTQQPQEEDDADDLISKRDAMNLVNTHLLKTKQEFMEESFCSSNPEAVRQIEEQLPNLIKAKPWIEDVVKNAPNRWQRAWELVNDLAPKAPPSSPQKRQEAQRIIENSQKPGSPAAVGKSATMSKVDYMRSIRGTPQWDEYKEKLMRGEV